MKKTHLFLVSILALGTALTACKKDPQPEATKSIDLNISGLTDLGPNFKYETWIVSNNTPTSLGTFDVDAQGLMSTTRFTGKASDIDAGQVVVISIEPFPNSDPTPSNVKILGGEFNGSTADLSIKYDGALGSDLGTAAGDFIIAAPTTTTTTDDLSGVWFINPSLPNPELTLPTLQTGWEYEGWAVIGGVPVSTGKFTDPRMADASSIYSGTDSSGPAYPGEDFIQNPPAGLAFPLDLSGQTIVISVEPVPDNSPEPFVLKPLIGAVSSAASPMTPYSLENVAASSNPAGTVKR